MYPLCCRQPEYELTEVQLPIAVLTHGKSSIEPKEGRGETTLCKLASGPGNDSSACNTFTYSNIYVNYSSTLSQPSPRYSSQGLFSHFSRFSFLTLNSTRLTIFSLKLLLLLVPCESCHFLHQSEGSLRIFLGPIASHVAKSP